MDDNERDVLVSALRTRLTALDTRVVAFRRDQADAFRRYAADRLRGVAADVAADVAQTINADYGHYPALYPGFQRSDALHAAAADMVTTAATTVVPATPVALVLPTVASPTERAVRRNDDFSGVFTPPFLPLLDSSTYDRSLSHVPSPDLAAAAASAVSIAPVKPTAPAAPAVPTASAAAAAATADPPTPVRPKGVLRAPSSRRGPRPQTAPRHSVRFLFEGAEVLPTVSPPALAQDLSWLLPQHHIRGSGTTYDALPLDMPDASLASPASPTSSALPTVLSPTETSVHFVRCEDPEDEEEHFEHLEHLEDPAPEEAPLYLSTGDDAAASGEQRAAHYEADHADGLVEEPERPMQRRMSSSDLVRALSKVPLEDPATWTVVDPQAEAHGEQAGQTAHVEYVEQVEEADEADEADEVDSRIFLAEPTNSGYSYAAPPEANGTQGTQDLRVLTDTNGTSNSNSNSNSNGTTPDTHGSHDSELFLSMRPSRNSAPADASPISNLTYALSQSLIAPMPVSLESAATPPTDTDGFPASVPAIVSPRTATKAKTKAKLKLEKASASPRRTEPLEDDGFFDFEHDDANDSHSFDDADTNGHASNGLLARTAQPYLSDDETDETDQEDHEDHEVNGIEIIPPEKLESVDEKPEDGNPPVDELPTTDEAAPAAVSTDRRPSRPGLPALLANHRQMMPRDVSQSLNRQDLRRTSLGVASPYQPASQAVSCSLGAPAPPLSVGSYRGRPISMFNVVKDPRILEEVAQLGAFSSFVGGVDGRTGVDGVEDYGSLRAHDAGLLSGTPRSLSERMMMEEAFHVRR